jgi:hypothetical protein
MTTRDEAVSKLLMAAFQMPSVQTMVSRKSSITNAFVNAIIPVKVPTIDEIDTALSLLEMEPHDVRCAYCGDASTEWDHLRPLVLNRRPTGFISEIANLVPACGKCNQSKGNKPWREWMISAAPRSPTGRKIADTDQRIARIESYERWKKPTKVDFESILGSQAWKEYWALYDAVVADLAKCQVVANSLRDIIAATVDAQVTRD